MAEDTTDESGMHKWSEWALALSAPGRGSVVVLKSDNGPVATIGSVISKNDVDTRKMCISHILVTPAPDLQGDVVVPSGGILESHRRTPTVLFDHGVGYKLPIARAMDRSGLYTVRKSEKKVTAKTYFTDKDPASDQLFTLAAEGMINGWSAGFYPIMETMTCLRKPVAKSDRGAFRFNTWWLKEYSLTPDPINRECLTTKVEKSAARMDPLLLQAMRPHLLKANPALITVPDHPLVNKSMANEIQPVDDGNNDDEELDTAGQDEGDNVPKSPGVQAAYMVAQGLSDLCQSAEQQIAQSDNPKFKKLIRNLCKTMDKVSAQAQSLASKMEAELGDDDGDEVDYENDDSADTADTDDDGGVVTKSGWKPPRFGLVTKSRSPGRIITPEQEKTLGEVFDELRRLRAEKASSK